MVTANNTLATLKQALEALHRHPDADVRTQADRWLEEFQQTQEAWQVADQLLHDSNSSLDILYFCSQTLRTKVQRDFDELPPNATDSLRDSLLALVIRFRNGPPAVRTQLCLALAGLAAHAPSSKWGEGHGVIQWLANELGSQPDAGSGLLELLTVLPQEADSKVRPERRRQFLEELSATFPDVLKLLEAYLAANSSSTTHRKHVILALGAWIPYASGSPTALITNSVILAALDGLDNSETFDEAVNAVCELIGYTVAGGASSLSANMSLVELIVSRLMSVRQRFSAALSKNSISTTTQGNGDVELDEDEETLKGLARLFAEMGEAYVDLIASGTDEALQMVQIIAEVTAHKDYEICAITFKFWHDLSSHLTDRSYAENNGGNDERSVNFVEKERRLSVFRPAFGLLASLVSFRVQYPPEYETWRKDERAEFKQTRYAIADILLDSAAVYGGESLLQLLAEPLFKEAETAAAGGPWDARKAEACLYCIRGIGSLIPRSENRILPKVMELLPMLPSHPLLLYTASLTIAAYADWLARSVNVEALLLPLLTLLTSAFSAGEGAPPAAALAFKHVCDACRDPLVASLEPLLQVYERVLVGDSTLRLDRDDVLEVIEGLCSVVSALPPEQCPKALQELCRPIVTSLEKVVISAQTNPLAPPPGELYAIHIDRIANIFRYVQQPQPLAAIFVQLWPLLKEVFVQRATDGRTMERLGRACKHAVRRCREHMAPSLGPLLEEVQKLYQAHQHPCCLYVASEVIKVFGRDPSCKNSLSLLIGVMFGQTLQLLTSLQDFTARPDIADDCFLLASRCMRYCPDVIISLPIFLQLLDCAIVGFLVEHREACKSVLSFLKDTLELPLSSEGAGFRPIIESAFIPRGPSLMRPLLAALMGGLPESRVDDIVDLARSLTELIGPSVSQWAAAVMNLVPLSAVSETEKLGLLQALSAGGLGMDGRTLRVRMEEVSEASRRSKRVIGIVQAALQKNG